MRRPMVVPPAAVDVDVAEEQLLTWVDCEKRWDRRTCDVRICLE